MSLFKRKKKEVKSVINSYDYSKWESDFGFLLLMMNRKVAFAKKYDIDTLVKKLTDKTAYIGDRDLNDKYSDYVTDVVNSLSISYKTFLIDKYFGSEKALTKFISETLIDEISTIAVNANMDKYKKVEEERLIKEVEAVNDRLHNRIPNKED